MATYTPNLNLKKPSTNENYDVVADLNDSKDKIDLAVGKNKKWINDIFVNVQDFGAVGDYDPSTGLGTDDTVAFQTALDSFDNLGGTLFVPTGLYLITSDLIFPVIEGTDTLRPIMIIGVENLYQGGTTTSHIRGQTAFYYTGAGTLFDLRKGSNSETSGLVGFKNFSAYGTELIGTKGINGFNVQGSLFENITFKLFDIGINLTGYVYYSIIKKVKSNYNLSYGAVFKIINGTTLDDCIFSMNNRGVSFSYSGHSVNVNSCWFEGNTEYGIYSADTFQVNVQDCYFEGNGISAIFFAGYEGSTQALLNINNSFVNIPVGGLCAIRFYKDVIVNINGLNITALNPSAMVVSRSSSPGVAKIYSNTLTFTSTVIPLAFDIYIVATIDVNTGKAYFKGGIGTDNTLPATTLGGVVRKMEVFDKAGQSLGFVPIYNSIT